MPEHFQAFLSELRNFVDASSLILDEQELQDIQSATYSGALKPRAILKVGSREHLSQIVRLANRHTCPLYPFSTGYNIGYGSKAPGADGCTLVDLSSMNRILDYDAKHGVLRVEPGVTFMNAWQFLQEHNSPFVLSGTGAPAEASLIGNTLERGLGKGLDANRAESVCDLEVVLADGSILTPGLSRFGNPQAKQLAKYGPGPALDSLFFQSNLGIVTAMSFWLSPRPSHFRTFYYLLKSSEKLGASIEALRGLKQKQIVRANVNIFNDYRLLGLFSSYPWSSQASGAVLPRQVVAKELKTFLPIPPVWMGEGALFCHSNAQARAEQNLVYKNLKGSVDQIVIIDEKRNWLIKKLLTCYDKLFQAKASQLFPYCFELSPFLGQPLQFTLKSCYFRMNPVPSSIGSPEKDRCGVIWYGPICPFEAEHVQSVSSIVEQILPKHGFEPAITLQGVTSRQIDVITSLTYDRTSEGADQQAMNCLKELKHSLHAKGYVAYRLGTHSQDIFQTANPSYIDTLRSIKKALDPQGIISPGRYDGGAL